MLPQEIGQVQPPDRLCKPNKPFLILVQLHLTPVMMVIMKMVLMVLMIMIIVAVIVIVIVMMIIRSSRMNGAFSGIKGR